MQFIIIAASLLVGACFSTNIIAIANVLLHNGHDAILSIIQIIK